MALHNKQHKSQGTELKGTPALLADCTTAYAVWPFLFVNPSSKTIFLPTFPIPNLDQILSLN